MIERLLAGEAALARGELDAADRLFTQVTEADPMNAIAVVGRARVALAHGAREDARAFAERALGLDPEEAAARRLLLELDTPAVMVPAPGSVAAALPETTRRSGWRGWLDRLLRRS
jgi:uncharacterized protein HemY